MIPSTSEIEPATFRLLAQCFNPKVIGSESFLVEQGRKDNEKNIAYVRARFNY
jgi:hypothetical protein